MRPACFWFQEFFQFLNLFFLFHPSAPFANLLLQNKTFSFDLSGGRLSSSFVVVFFPPYCNLSPSLHNSPLSKFCTALPQVFLFPMPVFRPPRACPSFFTMVSEESPSSKASEYCSFPFRSPLPSSSSLFFFHKISIR